MKWKLIIGILLMVASVGFMYMWESTWRDEITLETVIVADEDLYPGHVADESDFREIKITPQSMINGALSGTDIDTIIGKVVVSAIKENQQLLPDYFSAFREIRKEGFSNYVLMPSWIGFIPYSVTDSDYISVFALPDKNYLSSYKLVEVYEDGGIEIEAKLDDFYRIYDEISEGNTLLIVSEVK